MSRRAGSKRLINVQKAVSAEHGGLVYAKCFRCTQEVMLVWATTSCDTVIPVLQSFSNSVLDIITSIRELRVAQQELLFEQRPHLQKTDGMAATTSNEPLEIDVEI